jgi:hypothetical protein
VQGDVIGEGRLVNMIFTWRVWICMHLYGFGIEKALGRKGRGGDVFTGQNRSCMWLIMLMRMSIRRRFIWT